MKKIKSVLILFTFTLSAFVLRGQDIHFSQIYETPLFLSPANTGFYNGYVRGILNYRNQWSAMGNAYQTGAVSVDGGLFKSKKRPAFMGFGFTVYNDQAGGSRLRTSNILLHVSGLVKLGKNSALSGGVAGGVNIVAGNYGNLTYASQFNGNSIDPNIVSGEPNYNTFTTMDAAFGLAYELATYKRDSDHDDVMGFKIFYGAYHLNKPEQIYGPGSSYRLPVRMVYGITSVIDFEDTKFTTTPAIVYQTQGPYQQLMMGTYVKYRMSTGTKVTGEKTQNALGVGLFYRNKDALVPKLIADLGDFSIGLAYDVNVSAYRSASNYKGGFEVSLRYNNLASSLFESKREYK